MEVEDWATPSDGTTESDVYFQDTDEEDIQYEPGSFPKLQFRKNKSKACWDAEMGMAEVIEMKGRIWTTMGVVRKSKAYCFIEEIFGQPPLRAEIEDLEKKCDGIPLKFCHVDHGRVIYFSFVKVDLPILP